jgi:hypothetical protein
MDPVFVFSKPAKNILKSNPYLTSIELNKKLFAFSFTAIFTTYSHKFTTYPDGYTQRYPQA